MKTRILRTFGLGFVFGSILCINSTAAAIDRYETWVAAEDGQIGVIIGSEFGPLTSVSTTFDFALDWPVRCMAQVGDEMWLAGGPDGAIAAYNTSRQFVREFQLPGAGTITAIAAFWDGVLVVRDGGPVVERYTNDGIFQSAFTLPVSDGIAAMAFQRRSGSLLGDPSMRIGKLWVADSGQDILFSISEDSLMGPGSLSPLDTRTLPQGTLATDMTTTGSWQYEYCPLCDNGSDYVLVWEANELLVAADAESILHAPLDWDATVSQSTGLGTPVVAVGYFAFDDGEILIGDFNGDGRVDLADFVILKLNFGRRDVTPYTDGDTTGDSEVNLDDFVVFKNSFANNFGATTP